MIEENSQSSENLLAVSNSRVILLCTLSGEIVFVEGDHQVLGVSHQNIMKKCIEKIGLTYYSRLELNQMMMNGLFRNQQSEFFHAVIVKRKSYENFLSNKDKAKHMWENQKNDFLKEIILKISFIKAIFQDQIIQVRQTPVRICSQEEIMLNYQGEESLVLIQIQEDANHLKHYVSQLDYQKTCQELLADLI